MVWYGMLGMVWLGMVEWYGWYGMVGTVVWSSRCCMVMVGMPWYDMVGKVAMV